MNTQSIAGLIRPLVLLILIAARLLLSLGQTAWARPAQQPAGQTVITKTPVNPPEPSFTATPTSRVDQTDTPTAAPTPTGEQTDTPTATPTPTGDETGVSTSTPTHAPTDSTLVTRVPTGTATPTAVTIVEVPRELPRTGADALSWTVWALMLLSLAAGVALHLWARRANR